MKRKVLAIVLCAALVVCCMPTFSFASISKLKVGDNDNDGVIQYTALGDSISLGFGTGNCTIDNVYSSTWHLGYGAAPDTAYCHQLANNYDYNMNVWSGSQCMLRAEDVINLIDVNKFGADKFFYDSYYESYFKLSYLDYTNSALYNPLTYQYKEPVYTDEMPTIKQMNRQYKAMVKDADFITVTAGGNNYFSYLTSKLMAVLVDPAEMYSAYLLPEGLYYDYTKRYVYPKWDGAVSNSAQGIEVKGDYVYSDELIMGRYDLLYIEMVTYTDASGNYKLMAYSDASAYDDEDEYYGMTITKDQTSVSESEYVQDLINYYGYFDESFNDIKTVSDFNEKLLATMTDSMSTDLEEDLTKFYNKSTVAVFNVARTSAIAAAKVADKAAGENSKNLTRTVTALFDFLKSYLYSMGALEEAMPMLVSYIHELNPDAKVAITGLPPAFCDFEIQISEDKTIKLCDTLGGFYDSINDTMEDIAKKNSSYCRAIDITGAEMISQQNMQDMTDDERTGNYVTKLSTKDDFGNEYHQTLSATEFMTALYNIALSHPSADGQKYIAEQINKEFDFSAATTTNKNKIVAAIENIFSSIYNKVFNRETLFEKIFGIDLKNLFNFKLSSN